jgi:acetyl esterase/lipase
MLRLASIALLALIPEVMTATDFPLLTWDDLSARPRPKPDATIAYGDDEMQKVDVWLPAGKGPFQTVLMVHGGCWTTSIADRSLMNWIAGDLRAKGIAVWNIDYRGVDRPGGGYPGTFLDAAAAADALAANAGRFHLDTKHIVAVGHSAGGHLALWLAARPKLPRTSPLHAATPLPIAHVISLGGLPDLEETAASPDNGCGVDVVAQLVGASGTRPDVYADTSIPRLLPIGVPQDLVNGREDRIIPVRLGTGYEAQAKKAGDTVALHFVPATGHVELVTPDTNAWTETTRLIRAAFER